MNLDESEPHRAEDGTWLWMWAEPPVLKCELPTEVYAHLECDEDGNPVIGYPTREEAMDALREAIKAAGLN